MLPTDYFRFKLSFCFHSARELSHPIYVQLLPLLSDTQILDAGAGESTTAPTTVAGTRSGLIGRVVLGERALRLPERGDGPPCRVFELPIELPTSTTTNTVAKRRGKRVASAVSNRTKRPATIILFLERVPPPTRSSPSQDVKASSALRQGAPSTTQTTATTAAAAVTDHDTTTATTTAYGKNESAENALLVDPTASVTQVPVEGGREQQPRTQPRPQRPPAREKIQLRVLSAWGLSQGAKALDVVVAVMACGRGVGTTHVSSIGGTTSPEWIDER